MRTSLFAILAAAVVPFVAALDKPLDIEKVVTKECERKSERGDTVDVHYRGTLTDGM
jgi:FKBP-type peptidyl-prolyl cis-trans isomerase